MTHLALGDWTNALGGAAVVGLGLFVLSVRPPRVANVSFATFAVGFGGYFLLGNVADALHVTLSYGPAIPLFLAWAVGVVLMALTFPRPVAAAERGRLAAAAVVTLALTVSGFWAFFGVLGTHPVAGVMLASSMFAEAVLGGYLVLLALRFHRSPDATFRRQAVLTAAAITMYIGFIAGFGRTGGDNLLAASGPILAHAVIRVALLVGIATVWLAATSGRDARTARNMAWLSLVIPLMGLLTHAAGRIEGGHGVARLAMVAILAYAILRHRLLGLDAKVRWGVSRGSVAAAFVAAFFVASEAAQQFLGETTGSAYLGIAAAGALIFAIAPLQRAAERLAEKAVPATSPYPTATGGSDPSTVFRDAVSFALRDGSMTRREEAHLGSLAELIGIGPAEAVQIRHEVEDACKARTRTVKEATPE